MIRLPTRGSLKSWIKGRTTENGHLYSTLCDMVVLIEKYTIALQPYSTVIYQGITSARGYELVLGEGQRLLPNLDRVASMCSVRTAVAAERVLAS